MSIPAGFEDVMSDDELSDGEVVEIAVGHEVLAISKVDGVHYAVDNICPHAGGPLGDGDMEDFDVVCPYHGWAFDVRTGECNVAPDMGIATHEVRVINGRVCVRDAPAA
jgi:nitrite reductase/ring-hydroxylating ferredoxin subunit